MNCGDLPIDEWPNCAVPDCEYKSCLSAKSPLCHSHTFGLIPPKPEDYFTDEDYATY